VLLALLMGFSSAVERTVAWRRVAGHAEPIKVIAVLPFENLGDSADAYFADGVADEVRTKLAQVGGLEVIARGSSIEYQHPTSGPSEIAQELGAEYLLTGTVRWDKRDGTNRVRVTPELVEARHGRAARTRWVQQFDASLTDVFQVQADIATKVADAMGLVLGDSSRRELMAKRTENLAAYEDFLKGEAAAGVMKNDQASLRRAITFYESAVALDSTFVQAWSQLSRARSSLYSNGVPVPELGEQARVAAERARQLKSKDPSVYLATGDYYGSVNPIDNEQAVAAYEEGLRLAPDNVDLLGAAAITETSLGRWDGAAARLARATLLDPRSANTFRRLSVVQAFLRNYPAADSAADRAIALAPANPTIVSLKVMIALARGDLDSARAVVRKTELQIDPGTLLPFMAYYQDLYWVLDDEQQRQVLAAPPSAFDNDRGGWGIVRAEIYQLRGDRARARIYADSARLAFLEQTRAAPDDGQRRVLLGLAEAYWGRKDDAVRDGLAGVKLMPISQDGFLGPYVQLQLMRIYLLVGEPEKALDQLEPLLKVPFYLSPGWLRIDPTFEPVRKNRGLRPGAMEGLSWYGDQSRNGVIAVATTPLSQARQLNLSAGSFLQLLDLIGQLRHLSHQSCDGLNDLFDPRVRSRGIPGSNTGSRSSFSCLASLISGFSNFSNFSCFSFFSNFSFFSSFSGFSGFSIFSILISFTQSLATSGKSLSKKSFSGVFPASNGLLVTMKPRMVPSSRTRSSLSGVSRLIFTSGRSSFRRRIACLRQILYPVP
jgi:TolB-like protein